MRSRAFPRTVELSLYAASPIATIITAPLLARALGPDDRGAYGLATTVATFALTVSAWGQAETYMSEARAGRTSYRGQARIALVGGVSAAILAGVALSVLGLPLAATLITVLSIPFLNQTNLWRAVAVSAGELRLPALNGAGSPLLRVAAYVLLAAFAALNLESALLATQAAAFVAAILTVAVAARRIPPALSPPLSVRQLTRRGSIVITFDIFNAITLRSDIILLQIFSTPREVGIYAAPASLTTAALALSISFKSRMQAAVVRGEPTRTVLREAMAVAVLASLGAIILWIVAPWLVPILFGPQFTASILPMRILGLAAVPLLMLDLVQGILVVLARRKPLIFVGVTSATLMVLTQIFFVPRLAAVGASIAVLVSYSVAATIAWVVALRSLNRDRTVPSDIKLNSIE